ncbi:hypothetical protein H4J58_03195 [Colwellia sp. MB3u-70]|nr:hypothetical protein [Colwellia sp. MB3u-8]MBA6306134.1 hypothetical protein [Colwellia sp. MB3u-70]
MIKISTVALSLLITACSMQAPPYEASIENVQIIKGAKVKQVKVGKITSTKQLDSISLRGSSMYSPVNKSYGSYLQKALEYELKLAKLLSAVSSTVLTGEMLTNGINISSFSEGVGEASAKFVVTRDNKVIFDKIISTNHTFESSFMGAIAIPNAQASYVNLVQKLIKNLFEDKTFISVLKD